MKKHFFTLACIFSISLVACNSNSAQPHEHKGGEPVEENRIEATCTEDGSYDLVTYCVDDYEEIYREHKTIPALGHDLIHHEGKKATCTTDGYGAYDTCSRCNYSTKEIIHATGHQHTATREENRIDSDCTHDGSYDLVTYCTDDNVELSREHKTIPALGHDYRSEEINADYDHDGYIIYTCSRCGNTYNESNGESRLKYTITWKNYDGTVILTEQYFKGETPSYKGNIPEKREDGHYYIFIGWDKEIEEVNNDITYTALFVEPTLKSDNEYHWYEDDNGNKYNIENHDFCHEQIINKSTCQTKGSAQYSCDCGYFEIRDLELADHDFAPFVSNNDATCTKDGTKYHICKTCLLKETVVDEGSAKGHKWTLDTENSTQATCLEDGHYHYICDDCGATKDEEIPNYGGHDFLDGTCTKCGEFQYKDYLSLNVSLPHELTWWATKSRGTIYSKFVIDNVIFTAKYNSSNGVYEVQAKFVMHKTYANPNYSNAYVNYIKFGFSLRSDTDNEELYSATVMYTNVTELDLKVSKTMYITGNSNYCKFDGSKHYTLVLSEQSYY